MKYFQKKIERNLRQRGVGLGGSEGFKKFSCKEKERNAVIDR